MFEDNSLDNDTVTDLHAGGDPATGAGGPGSPAVSVLIPAYNVGKFVGQCLDSVLSQDSVSLEVIVVDDGSTDDTAAILERRSREDSRLKVFHQKNAGVASARNRLLDSAAGEWIYFLDADDTMAPHALRRMVGIAEQKRLDALFFSSDTVYETPAIEAAHPEFKGRYSFNADLSEPLSGQAFFSRCMEVDEWKPLLWLSMYRRSALAKASVRFAEGFIFEDTIFVLRATLRLGRVARIPDKMHFRRVRENSIMTSRHPILDVKSQAYNLFAVLDCSNQDGLEPATLGALGKLLARNIRAARSIIPSLDDEERHAAMVSQPCAFGLIQAFSNSRPEEEFQEKLRSIGNLKAAVERRDGEIKRLKAAVERRDGEVESLNDKMKLCELRASTADSQSAIIRQELQALREEIDSISNSPAFALGKMLASPFRIFSRRPKASPRQ